MTKATEKTEAIKKTTWFKYPLALLCVFILGAIVYQTHFKSTPNVGKGEPLAHAPKANIKVLNEADTLPDPSDIVDVTIDIQKSTPFPQRVIAPARPKEVRMDDIKPASPVSAPDPIPTNLETAELLQATLELAKQHSQQQVLSAKFHTLMGLILNPTISSSEQLEWAALSLPLAEKMRADTLVLALKELTTPTEKDAETPPSTLPTWLAPLQNLVQVRRVDDAPDATTHTQALANLRAAYQAYLMNESY